MIEQKKKKCIECGYEKYIFSKGKCQQCSSKNNNLEKSHLNRTKTFIKKVTDKKKQEKKLQKNKRDVYFEYHIKKCFSSEESYKPITSPTKSNICHLIDKGRHPSLEDNLDNYVYLTFAEHERFDYLLYNHEFEKLENEFKNSWGKVCTRLEKLLPLCQENTIFIRRLNKYLNGR